MRFLPNVVVPHLVRTFRASNRRRRYRGQCAPRRVLHARSWIMLSPVGSLLWMMVGVVSFLPLQTPCSAAGTRLTDELPILFTKIPENEGHSSSHCDSAMLIAHPTSSHEVRQFNRALLPTSSNQFGTSYGGWLGDGKTAVVYKLSYRVPIDAGNCDGTVLQNDVIEPFIVSIETGNVIARPTLLEDDASSEPTADSLAMACFYYRSQLIVSPRSSSPAKPELWFLDFRFPPNGRFNDPHCNHLSTTDIYMHEVSRDRYGRWSSTGFQQKMSPHGCTIAPSGKAWACESPGGLVVGAIPPKGDVPFPSGPPLQPKTGLNYAVWQPDSRGFVYMAYDSSSPNVIPTASLVYVPITLNDNMEPIVGKPCSLAIGWPPAQICATTIGPNGVSCEAYAGDYNHGNIGSDLPAWSRDSQSVYFSALKKQGGRNSYHRVLIHASPYNNSVSVITDKWGREAGHPAVSPSGGYVAFLSTRGNNNKLTDVFLVNVRTHAVTPLTNIEDRYQAYSPIWWTPAADSYATLKQSHQNQ